MTYVDAVYWTVMTLTTIGERISCQLHARARARIHVRVRVCLHFQGARKTGAHVNILLGVSFIVSDCNELVVD